jgi:hypothetical protein
VPVCFAPSLIVLQQRCRSRRSRLGSAPAATTLQSLPPRYLSERPHQRTHAACYCLSFIEQEPPTNTLSLPPRHVGKQGMSCLASQPRSAGGAATAAATTSPPSASATLPAAAPSEWHVQGRPCSADRSRLGHGLHASCPASLACSHPAPRCEHMSSEGHAR